MGMGPAVPLGGLQPPWCHSWSPGVGIVPAGTPRSGSEWSLWSLCRCCGQHGGEAEVGRGHPEEATGGSGEDQQPPRCSPALQVKRRPSVPEQDVGPPRHRGSWEGAPASPRRSLEPLDPEGPSPPMLSTFLPPVPSTSLDPPEHFPLRKTGKASGMSPGPSRPRECPCVPPGPWLELRTGPTEPVQAGPGLTACPRQRPSPT